MASTSVGESGKQKMREYRNRGLFIFFGVAYLFVMFVSLTLSIQDSVVWLPPILVLTTVPTMGAVAKLWRVCSFWHVFKPGNMGYLFVFGGFIALPMVALGAAMCWQDVQGGSDRDAIYTSFVWMAFFFVLMFVSSFVFFTLRVRKCVEAGKPDAGGTPTMQFFHLAIMPSVGAALLGTVPILFALLIGDISWYGHSSYIVGVVLIFGGTLLLGGLFALDKSKGFSWTRACPDKYSWANRCSEPAVQPSANTTT